MKNKKWFTLVELLLALMIAWTLIGIVMTIYTGIMWADVRMSDKRLLTSEASDLMDMIHTVALDYTIDYEEYFNRSRLWFLPWDTWFTTYGNSWERYYCLSGSSNDTDYKYKLLERNDWSWWCPNTWYQKYLEYQFQHRKLLTWDLNHRENSWSNMHFWPIAVFPNTWLDYLYLINPEGTERYYFRRIRTGANNNLNKVQVLRLKWYDAWIKQNFSDEQSTWRYDWFIDTWACDYSQWFRCHWAIVTWSDRLPYDFNDWWIDITSNKVSVNDFRIDIYPNKNPYLDTWNDVLLDPYIKISFTMDMSKPSTQEITLSTTLSFKNSYFNFPIEKRRCVPNDDGTVSDCYDE